MQRPFTEVKLPISGYTAQIATYMTYADRQEMAKAIIKNKEITQDEAQKMIEGKVSVNGADAVDSEMVMLQRMTLKLVNPEGGEEDQKDVINLPDEDVDLIKDELAKIPMTKKKQD